MTTLIIYLAGLTVGMGLTIYHTVKCDPWNPDNSATLVFFGGSIASLFWPLTVLLMVAGAVMDLMHAFKHREEPEP